MSYYHIYSNGAVTKTVLFRKPESFIFTLNLFAIAAHLYDLRVLCETVMGTHFHLIAAGDFQNSLRFKDTLKTRLRKYLAKDLSHSVPLDITVDPLEDDTEVKNKFMYVLRNPIEAGFSNLPTEYRWGPGNIYFTDFSGWYDDLPKIGMLSFRKQRELFHTHNHLVSEWRYYQNGLIAPASYIDVEAVRRLFGSVKAYIAFMYQKKDKTIEINKRVYSQAITDLSQQDLRKKVQHMARVHFGKGLSATSVDEKINIAIEMYRKKEAPSVLMLAKTLNLDLSVLDSILKG